MKQEFQKTGKSYATAAAEIGCSKPMLVAVVNHGTWPKKGADKLREKLKQYFETNGADIPASLRNDLEAAPAHPNESEDKEMLLRKATLTQAAKQHFGIFRDPFNDEIQSADDVFMTPGCALCARGNVSDGLSTAVLWRWSAKAVRANLLCAKTCKTVLTAKAVKSS